MYESPLVEVVERLREDLFLGSNSTPDDEL